ncbi:ribokinase [Candidatus Bathyarchaeota archaeon]|nr:ribokinase [Candidatus Bathyarchaeota archaeon]
MKTKIVVVGSLHMDLTVKTKTIPRIGETVLGEELKTCLGGKGANQAVAAAKLGANVTLIGRVGADFFGMEAIRNAKQHGINTKLIKRDRETYTSLALIMVDKNGNNIITVAPGADLRCSKEDIDRADPVIKSSDILLMQLEIPLSVVEYTINKVYRYGIKVILNPSPAHELSNELLRKIHILIPNEQEAEVLSGVKISNLSSAKNAAKKILLKGVENIILTIGKKGAIVVTKEEVAHIKGLRVETVDTTGAGDAFCGALAIAISSRGELKEAVVYANCAAALATTKIGAQEPLPTQIELEKFMRERGLV